MAFDHGSVEGVGVVEGAAAGFLGDAFHGELVRTEHAFELLPRAGKIAHVEGWISDDAQMWRRDKWRPARQ